MILQSYVHWPGCEVMMAIQRAGEFARQSGAAVVSRRPAGYGRQVPPSHRNQKDGGATRNFATCNFGQM
jgi:hypothetical protein